MRSVVRPSWRKKTRCPRPQGGRPELVGIGHALDDVVGKSWPHMVQQHVREQIDVLVAQGRHRGIEAGLQPRRVAQVAADGCERLTSPVDR